MRRKRQSNHCAWGNEGRVVCSKSVSVQATCLRKKPGKQPGKYSDGQWLHFHSQGITLEGSDRTGMCKHF